MKILKTKSPLVFALLLCVSNGFADNPIVQTYFTADPAPMVYNDTLFLYTSHDEDVTVNNFFSMNDWKLYSTVDMANWTDHGTVATGKTFSWFNDNAWAPQTVARNGKFYMYCPVNNNSGARIGVLVSDSPYGPFKDPIGKEIAQSGSMAIDPTAFVDDDGQAYLFWGNGNLRMVKLNEDMISTTGPVTSNIPMQGFTEGPWFYKRGSLYYLVYAGSGEHISYATSNSPNGPWTFRGDIFGKPPIFTNHPGVIDYKGHSYCFYHNGSLSGGDGYKRSVCVEEFTYGADGSIPLLQMTTEGPKQLGTLNPYDTVQAETMCWSKGVKTEPCSEGGLNLSLIENGDYVKVKGVDFGDGAISFDARVAANSDGGKIELYIDKLDGTLIGTCNVPAGTDWQTYETVSCDINNAAGIHDLYLKFTGASSYLFNVNWWRFHSATNVKFTDMQMQSKASKMNTFTKDANTIRFNYNVPENFSGKTLKVTFSDLQGRMVASQIFSGNTLKTVPFAINRNQLRSGMYVVHVSAENKVLFSSSYMMY